MEYIIRVFNSTVCHQFIIWNRTKIIALCRYYNSCVQSCVACGIEGSLSIYIPSPYHTHLHNICIVYTWWNLVPCTRYTSICGGGARAMCIFAHSILIPSKFRDILSLVTILWPSCKELTLGNFFIQIGATCATWKTAFKSERYFKKSLQYGGILNIPGAPS